MWNLKYDIYETETHIENRLMIAKGEGTRGVMEWEIEISSYIIFIFE